MGLSIQVLGHASLSLCAEIRTELSEGCLLNKRWQVLVSIARDGTGRNDFDGFLNCDDLISSQLLPRLKVRRLLLTCGGKVCQILCICIPCSSGIFQISFRVSLGLQLGCLCLSLLITILGGLSNLSIQILHQHVVSMLGVHLFLLQCGALINEFIEQFLEHLNDSGGLEFIRICLWCAHGKSLGILLEKDINGFLGLCWDQ